MIRKKNFIEYNCSFVKSGITCLLSTARPPDLLLGHALNIFHHPPLGLPTDPMRLRKIQFGPHPVALGLRPHFDFGPEHLGDLENGEGFLRAEPKFIPLTHFAHQYQTIDNIFDVRKTSPLGPRRSYGDQFASLPFLPKYINDHTIFPCTLNRSVGILEINCPVGQIIPLRIFAH